MLFIVCLGGDVVFALGETSDAFAYFIGQSYNASLNSGGPPVNNITFEPGCRSDWHIHHGTTATATATATRS